MPPRRSHSSSSRCRRAGRPQRVEQAVGAALLRPLREVDGHPAAAIGVREAVERYVHAGGLGLVDQLEQSPGAAFVGLAAEHVGDVQRAVGLAGYLDGVAVRVEELVAERVAGVCVVEASQPARLCRQLDDLVVVGVAPRRVVEPGRQREGALVHALSEHRLHRLDVRAGRRDHVPAYRAHPQRRVADDIGDVHRGVAVEQVQVLGDGRPGARQRRVALDARVHSEQPPEVLRVVERRVGEAVDTDYLGGDALVHLGHVLRVGQQHQARVAVNIDEAGADDLSRSVDHAHGLDLGDVTPKDADAVALDADGGVDPRVDAAVQYQAAGDEQVVHSLSPYPVGVYSARADGGLT